MAEPTAMETSPAPVLFDFSRPNKKRNYIRRVRAESPDAETVPKISTSTTITESATVTSTPTSSSIPSVPTPTATSTIRKDSPSSDAEADEPTNLAEILRRRKKQSRLKQGLDIAEIVPKVACRDAEEEMPDADEEAAKDAAEQELAAVVNRFTHQTGHVLDVDKHMVAYIESQMEKRRLLNSSSSNAVDSTTTATTDHPPNPSTNKSAFWQPTRPIDRGATLGKLHEVDLGEENKLKNIHRTQEATRRLEGGDSIEDVNMDGGDVGGKKGRRRRRRNSQDIQRDKLVEEVLKESKLQVELYDEPGSDNGHPSDEEGAADDRIAEKFRREFLDALMSRRRRRGNYQKTKKKDDAKKPRGPKLGGSRSARAAMRESQLAASGGAGASSGGIRK